jgi:nitroimidazol reductase NimA-like FMN-containing flavoprotein (pyridoxamine 5'-phosphate oxidase superfamily)
MADKKPTVPMPRDQLEAYLIKFIHSHNVCTIATCKDNVPRATALEYEAEGAAIYILLGPGQKGENLKANPQISASIHDPLNGWLTVKGLQITGQPVLLTSADTEYPEAWRIFNRANEGKENWDVPPPNFTILKIVPQKMELLEVALKAQGFKVKQSWEA